MKMQKSLIKFSHVCSLMLLFLPALGVANLAVLVDERVLVESDPEPEALVEGEDPLQR